MDVKSIFDGVISNAIWWVIGLIVLFITVAYRKIWSNYRDCYAIAKKLREQGINRFIFSRHEYPERLDAYLSRANHSIKIVSISLKLTSDESGLTELFRRKLASNPSFEIFISLLQPDSNAANLAATSLDIKPEMLKREIEEMLCELKTLRDSLPPSDKDRFHILTHDCLPMGSAILLDATQISGTIQVETKLYRSTRVESFSYEVKAPSPFYEKNFTAWNRVLHESKVV